MNLYSTIVFLHVITAILGLGPLTLLAMFSSLPDSKAFSVDNADWMLRLAGRSLLGMFVTGAALIAFTHGALGEAVWMRVAFGLFVLLGFLLAMARRQVRKGRAFSPPVVPAALRQLAWSMCAVTAAITYLMEAKPW
jgi:hypothetical protein